MIRLIIVLLLVKMVLLHYKCRLGVYPRSIITRFPVPDCKVPWSYEYKEYNPPSYTDPNINSKTWADPNIGSPHFKPKWNDLDGILNRKSYMGTYTIANNYPLNPIGRTGIQGRGILGRWGPNHAADPIITRWKNDNNEKLLQFVAIKRRDTGEWAIPGGMVDPGEEFSVAAIREFQEEALNFLDASEEIKEKLRRKLKKFFSTGTKIYTGYVDDPRNTDNAWMETTAYNYHDETGSIVGGLELQAGDDAVGVRWVDVTPELNLYASHKDIINKVLTLHQK